MNNDIANKFKSSLENYEVPYEVSAWDKMSKKLDAKSNAGENGGSKFFSAPKLWIISSIVVIGASVAIFNTPKESSKTTASKLTHETAKPATLEENNEPIVQLTKNETKTGIQKHNIQLKEKTTIKISKAESKTFTTTVVNTNESNLTKQIINNKGNEKYTKNFILPRTNKIYCLGEKIEIFNPNTNEIILNNVAGKPIKIDGQESVLVTLKQEGQYTWNGDKSAFEVKEKPTVNFSLPSDIIYENGIPTITLTSDLNVKSLKWIFDQKSISTNDGVKINIFNKEKYSVTLAVVGFNGCENQLTKTFYPDTDFNYNLKAPNGFEPLSNNSKRNTFLPLSLLERDTPFKMLIIDPKDGKVIFETNDKNNPWDGKNQFTDQLVTEGSEYIWKVILMNPEKYEKNEYRGTITRK
jgi:uncharacterized protein (DUF2147 family)